jgi:CheY-like chemotaxis protein
LTSDDAHLPPLRVLLVDDNKDAREVLAELLERLSCDVQTAGDGLEALDMTRIRQPQVLLLDLQMPRLGGIETAKELRRRFSAGESLPFRLIAVTGDVDSQSHLIQDGLFDQVMTKPVGLAQLRDVLRQVPSEQAPTN